MPKKKSRYIQNQKQQRTGPTKKTLRKLGRRDRICIQMALDAAMLAANEVFNMGPSRAGPFHAAFQQAFVEIAQMQDGDSYDLAYTKTRLDERLKQVCGEHFEPWEKRYGG